MLPKNAAGNTLHKLESYMYCPRGTKRAESSQRLSKTGIRLNVCMCYSVYSNWYRDAQSLRAWLFDYLPSHVVSHTPTSFRTDVLASSDPWIIDFYAPWCGHCQVFAPEFEQVAQVRNADKHYDNVHH